ncbi:MAG: class I SAM-dependent methyltransferase [Gaiellales bacterium]
MSEPKPALYDAIAGLYDDWSESVIEDVEFYVEQALAAGGPMVELAVGTGRIAVPVAKAGIDVIGIDESPGMLAVAGRYAEQEGVADRLDLRLGDIRMPPVAERVPLVTIPFRSLLHLPTNAEKLRALGAAAALLEPGGRVVFDVFAPSEEDIAETNGVWLEREPEIFERADWDRATSTLRLSVRRGEEATSFTLHWLEAPSWRALIANAGLEVEAVYGWFDGRPWAGGEDMVWVCRRVDDGRAGP